ncbi:hypothetical protein PZ938_00035 [Luteipulveratus sp. YIM 133132]|uniref:hypothetical protein n=1 Tax=Luteipulveratus flavus TaxID=3031728 RepID=UPI0023B19B98|nr:hypothetical protein [Luteipulveratus sp. YIM 133132]MDE9363982.1 hypothetical protein [Luteipulveratus sp. YIM 133132]
MNSYGHRAMEHWKRWLPSRYALIPDPRAFFEDLGEQASAQMVAVSEQLEEQYASDLAGLGYLEKVGRLNAIRKQAEEVVLAEMVLLEPEPGTDPEPDKQPAHLDPLSEWMDLTGMPRDRDHELWRMREDETISNEEFLAAAEAWEQSLRERLSQNR